MLPNERVATPPSPASRATSEESTPLAKRRRIDTLTDSGADTAMSPSVSATHDSGYDEALQLGEAQAQQQAVPPEPIATKRNTCSTNSPFSELSKTIVTLEFGNKLQAQHHVHLELLCSHSSKFAEICLQAEDLVDAYAEAKAIRKQVKALPVGNPDAFSGEKCREKAMDLIIGCLNNFPLVHFQEALKKVLVDATDQEFQDNEKFKVGPKQAKVDRPKYPKDSVRERLQQLNSEAVRKVIERLRLALWNLNSRERKSADNDVVKAAAQRRILLPGADQAAVHSLVEWIYRNTLIFTDADHLCRIHAVAEKLGMMRYAEACVDKLYTASLRILDYAKSHEIRLHELLEQNDEARIQYEEISIPSDPLSSLSVVFTVFKSVVHAKSPPARLLNLVVDAIAGCGDESLLHELLPSLTNEIRGQVLMAMMRNTKANAAAGAKEEYARAQVHSDASRSGSIKSELHHDDQQETKQDWNMAGKEVVSENSLAIAYVSK